MKKIVVLTGAGISADSGISTYRDNDGLWEQYSLEEVATPDGYQKNKPLVLDFYQSLRKKLPTVHPNPAHHALARLDREFNGHVLIATQNVDDLHERAETPHLHKLHGTLMTYFCTKCKKKHNVSYDDDITVETVCNHCNKKGCMRPDIVWFGEMPYRMEWVELMVKQADLFVSIGTSGQVYPAAGLVGYADRRNVPSVELNMEETNGMFNKHILGRAAETVPEFVESVLSGSWDLYKDS